MHPNNRRKLRRTLLALCLLAILPVVCDLYISLTTKVYRDSQLVPQAPVALVLGTSPTHRGRVNLFYKRRLEAARDLYEAGAVRAILVSGDNGSTDYDEPGSMRRDLIDLGVHASVITTDHAGFRTLDSVVRARGLRSRAGHHCLAALPRRTRRFPRPLSRARSPGLRRSQSRAQGLAQDQSP